MLNLLTRKLCPLMTLAIATVGCGKKISDSDTQPARSTENQELPATMILDLDGTKGTSFKTHTMPKNGSFELPSRLKVTGNALGKSVDITYDVDPYDSDNYQFKCSYTATSPTDMKLNKCVDSYGGDFGNIAGEQFGFYKNDIIEMRFTGAPATDLKVEAFYTVDWK